MSQRRIGNLFRNRTFYLWCRELHLYTGLFISPFILVFAISTILFNHTYKPWSKRKVSQTQVGPLEVPPELKNGMEGIPAAQEILRQIGISGEVGFVRYQPKQQRLMIPVFKPGKQRLVNVDLATRTATVEQRKTDVWQSLLYLHRTPGPHNLKSRGNWVYTRIWGMLADSAVYLTLFLSATGIYLWVLIRAERRMGFILLGTGALSFCLIVVAVVG